MLLSLGKRKSNTTKAKNTVAIILANFFHEHSKYAIKCMEKGIHIFCECISNGTMAEGVELIRAAEKSSSIYFLAENYPQMIFNREIKIWQKRNNP